MWLVFYLYYDRSLLWCINPRAHCQFLSLFPGVAYVPQLDLFL